MPFDDVIRCPGCKNWLGVVRAGEVIVRHRGREIVGATRIVCEKCGETWRAVDVALVGAHA